MGGWVHSHQQLYCVVSFTVINKYKINNKNIRGEERERGRGAKENLEKEEKKVLVAGYHNKKECIFNCCP